MLYHYELACQEVNARFEESLHEAERDRRYRGLRKAQTTIEGMKDISRRQGCGDLDLALESSAAQHETEG